MKSREEVDTLCSMSFAREAKQTENKNRENKEDGGKKMLKSENNKI